jgi:hypothetical protein
MFLMQCPDAEEKLGVEQIGGFSGGGCRDRVAGGAVECVVCG